MDQEQIDVICLQSFQRLLHTFHHFRRMMKSSPQLQKKQSVNKSINHTKLTYFCGNEDIFPLQFSFLEFVSQSLTDLALIAVYIGSIDMTISQVNSVADGILHFIRL